MDEVRLWLPFIAFALSLYALGAKWMEKPRLRVQLGPVVDDDPNAVELRFVHLSVQNPRLPWFWRWLTYRQPARNTRLEVTFFAVGGTQPKFSFDGRWTANPAPIQRRWVGGESREIFDEWLVHTGRFLDIASGSKPQDVAIAFKRAGDENCFGFTNESYEGGGVWSQPRFLLAHGNYRVEARAVSGEIQSQTSIFLLHNDGPSRTDMWLDVPEESGALKALRRVGLSVKG